MTYQVIDAQTDEILTIVAGNVLPPTRGETLTIRGVRYRVDRITQSLDLPAQRVRVYVLKE